jgi:hypothetical protein
LIAAKQQGAEQSTLTTADLAFHEQEFLRLNAELEAAGANSHLPDVPTAQPALHELLLELRGVELLRGETR